MRCGLGAAAQGCNSAGRGREEGAAAGLMREVCEGLLCIDPHEGSVPMDCMESAPIASDVCKYDDDTQVLRAQF